MLDTPTTAVPTDTVNGPSAVVENRSDAILDAAQNPHHGSNHEDGDSDPQEELRSLHCDAQYKQNYSDNDQCKYKSHKNEFTR